LLVFKAHNFKAFFHVSKVRNCCELWPPALDICEGINPIAIGFIARLPDTNTIKNIKLKLTITDPAGFSPVYASHVNTAFAKPRRVLLPAPKRIHYKKFKVGRVKVIHEEKTKQTRQKA